MALDCMFGRGGINTDFFGKPTCMFGPGLCLFKTTSLEFWYLVRGRTLASPTFRNRKKKKKNSLYFQRLTGEVYRPNSGDSLCPCAALGGFLNLQKGAAQLILKLTLVNGEP